MAIPAHQHLSPGTWLHHKIFLGKTPGEYFRSLITPGHILAAIILAVGLPITYYRFVHGIESVTNLNDNNPWGLWIGFDVLCGVALAAGGFIIGSATHLFGMKEYQALVRPAILTGFLGYALVVVGLLYDLGRPWRLPYPMVVSLGTTSVLFEVGWCVALYLVCQFIEILPPIFEWIGWKRLRAWAVSLTIGATVMAVVLSTLHQSSLGALFLITPGKLHPLWYSIYLPVTFLASAVSGGIGMIIAESSLSHHFFHHLIKDHTKEDLDRLIVGLGRAGAVVMYMNFILRWIGVAHDMRWSLLFTNMGLWWLVEVVGFIGGSCLLFIWGVRRNSARIVRIAGVLTVLSVILNRFNVSMIAFNWNSLDRYVPRWTEIWISVTIVTVGVLIFKWMVNRMPILMRHPDYSADAH
ncbi:MAG: NrfD/PsrC family molybdoenzyme membrane anchor subunit [Calditrichota bacterium]